MLSRERKIYNHFIGKVMNNLYVISGVTGMTGNEVTRQLLQAGHTVLGFDNFFASSLDSVKDVINHPKFLFRQYDLND